jgi:TonB family protein
MASQTPQTPPRFQRARSFLLYAFGISILLHILLGPLFTRFRPPEVAKEQVEKVSVTKRIVVQVPTPPPPPPPTPKPTPPPTPPPKATAKPPPAPAAKLKVEPPKTHTQTVSGPSEPVAPPAQGNANGAPGGTGSGNGSGGNGVAPGFSTAPPPPPPTKPPCANPNVPPKTLSAYAPDTPDIARQQGITGTVEVKVDLNEKSQILGVSIYKTANPLLNKAAMDAAKQSKFQTEIQNCSPIASSYRYIVDFQAE